MNFDCIPASIRRQIEGQPYTVNETGMSGSSVLVFPDAVLKIGPHSQLTDGMLRVLRWLEGRLPAPRVIYPWAARMRSGVKLKTIRQAALPGLWKRFPQGTVRTWMLDSVWMRPKGTSKGTGRPFMCSR